MLAKINRLRDKKQINHCYKGKSFVGGDLCFYIRPNGLSIPRLGTVVSKKVNKLAVARNRLTRVLRAGFLEEVERLSGFDIVVVVLRRALSKKACLAIGVATWKSEWDGLTKSLSK